MGDYTKDLSVKKVQEEILAQAKSMLSEARKTNDWESYDVKMTGLFRSYALCSHKVLIEAMAQLICDNNLTKSKIDEDILGGNYGLKVQASKMADKLIEQTENIIKTSGVDDAKRYVSKFNECQKVAVTMQIKAQKNMKEALNDEKAENMLEWITSCSY